MAILTRDQLRNQLRNRDIAPVYVLFGAESYLRDLAARTITDLAFGPDSFRDFNDNEFSLSNADDLAKALAAAEQLPMMAPRRVVKITEVKVSPTGAKDTLKEESESVLKSYLQRPVESSVVIFVADDFDKRRRMAKLLIENSRAVEFVRLQDSDLVAWTRKEFRTAGFDAEEKAIFHLVGLVGDNLRRLTSEIRKVTTAALPDKIVTYKLVDSLVTNSREVPNFNLTDHLFGDNKIKALKTLKKILDDGAEPLMILGLLAQNIRKLLMASELCDKGAERAEIMKIIKLPPKFHDEFIKTALRIHPQKLVKVIDRLADADLAIKTSRGGGGKAGAKMQIEILFSEILAI